MESKAPATIDKAFVDELCLFYLRIEDYEHASKLAKEMLNEDPQNRTALMVLGSVAENQDNFSLALYYYASVLRNDPNDSDALKRKAAVEMHIRNNKSALSDITRSLQLNNKDAEAYLIRGLIYFYLFQKKIEAIIDYNQALRLEPDNVYALFNRGYAYLKYGNHNYARDDFEQAAHLGYQYASEMLGRYFTTRESSLSA